MCGKAGKSCRITKFVVYFRMIFHRSEEVCSAAFAGKKLDGDAPQAEGPRCEQVEGGVPREVVDAGGGFEEDHGRALNGRNFIRNTTGHLPNL